MNNQNNQIKVLQFGEGKFLRAFVDYFIDIANKEGVWDADVAVIKPIPMGSLEALRRNDNKYTVVLRGKIDGKIVSNAQKVECIKKSLCAYEDYEEYMALASLPSLSVVISNTTEAGISLKIDDDLTNIPETYPGKLTQFLYKRFNDFNGDMTKGLVILPVELIESNGTYLKKYVKELAYHNNYPEAFINWLDNACVFCNTLVDRIVTGYPGEEAEEIFKELGYRDELLDVAEPFGLWVIESDKDVSEIFPVAKAGMPIVFTDNLRPYRERKVRVLNGAHTSTVLGAWLAGLSTVKECMNHSTVRAFMEKALSTEIAPYVKLPKDEVDAFVASVIERFENPFLAHKVLDISLNSVSKWKVRVLPSFEDYYSEHKTVAPLLTLSFAALLAFYSGEYTKGVGMKATRALDGVTYDIKDDAAVMEFFSKASKLTPNEYVKAVATNTSFWDCDLTNFKGFAELATTYLESIKSEGMEATIKNALNGGK